jgi:tetratricopeptide (TPR) repeat protein
MGYKGTTKSLKDIGKELGVAHILEGSVQRAGDEIRIVSQLIETKSDKHLWAETYDEKLKSLFAVQSDIAKKIALALETEISGDVVRRIDERPTESLIAWDNYLKGIEYSYVSNRLVDIEKSQEYFDKAFQLDPNFASALAKSAYLDLQIYWLGYDHIHSRINKAKSKIEQATALSSLSPEVLEATGYYYYYAYRDYSEALKYFDQAKNLEPGNSSHIQSIGYILRRQGKIEESLVNLHRVLETSKNDASLAFQIMLTYEQSRKYKKAEEMIDVALRLFPDNHVNLMQKAWFKYYEHKNLSLLVDELMILRNKYKDVNYRITFNIADALFRNRNYNLVIDEIEKIKEPFNIGQNNYTPHIFFIGRAQELMGMEKKAKVSYNTAASLLEKQLLLNPQDIRISSDLALVYAYLNRKEDAIRMIESAMIQIPIEKDYTDHGEYYDKEIEINLVLGNTNKAIKMIERSSKIFGGLSYFDLLHPKWDSSRDNVQFQSILNSLSSNL